MPKIIYHGVTYTQDASTLTNGSNTIKNDSGKLENKSIYVRGGSTSGSTVDGLFRIYSGTAVPSSDFGQNGDIFLVRQS